MSEPALRKTITRIGFEAGKAHKKSPLDILLFLSQEHGRFNEEWRATLDSEVVAMEVRSGMTSLDTSTQRFDFDDNYAYAGLTRDLHACNTDLVFLGHVLDFQLELEPVPSAHRRSIPSKSCGVSEGRQCSMTNERLAAFSSD